MKRRHACLGVAGLALAMGLGCSGKLEVGEEPEVSASGGTGSSSSGGSTSTAGVGGSTGMATGAAGSVAGVGASSSMGGTASTSGATGGFEPSVTNGSTVTTAGGGTSNSWVDEVAPTEPVPGSATECPVGPLHPDSPCETTGLSCGYRYDSQWYQECACTRAAGGDRAWRCENYGYDLLEACPLEVPEHGADCFGYYSLTCWYPYGNECFCFEAPGTWECSAGQVVELPELPAQLNLEVSVGELSDSERETWCGWYSQIVGGGEGHPPLPDQPVGQDGYVSNSACYFEPTVCAVSMPAISKAQCVANLRLSECEAPVGYLGNCVREVFSGVCGQSDDGCFDYLDAPVCAGTMILDHIAEDGCGVRVK